MTQYRNSKWLNLTAAAALLLAVLILFQFLYQKDNKYTNGLPMEVRASLHSPPVT